MRQRVTYLALAALLLVGATARAEEEFRALVWPVPFGTITSGVGWRVDPITHKRKWHNGTDIAVPVGTPVNAVAPGVVYFAGWHKGGYGNLVVIQHGIWFSMYGHNSKVLVRPGQRVDERTIVALAGSTGHSTGSHVHLEFRRWPGAPNVERLRHDDPVPQEAPQPEELQQETRPAGDIATAGPDQGWVNDQMWNKGW